MTRCFRKALCAFSVAFLPDVGLLWASPNLRMTGMLGNPPQMEDAAPSLAGGGRTGGAVLLLLLRFNLLRRQPGVSRPLIPSPTGGVGLGRPTVHTTQAASSGSFHSRIKGGPQGWVRPWPPGLLLPPATLWVSLLTPGLDGSAVRFPLCLQEVLPIGLTAPNLPPQPPPPLGSSKFGRFFPNTLFLLRTPGARPAQ